MKVRELAVPGALEFTPDPHRDHRGHFLEVLRATWWREATGRDLPVAQVNCSVNHRDVVRGVHFTRLPGQAKFVSCMAGEMIDVVVDLRVGSPVFGFHELVHLDALEHRVVFLPEGVGHGIASLADGTTAFYLCSAGYDPANEYGVHPLDPELGVDWSGLLGGAAPILSERDRTAPTMAQARELFPDFQDCLRHYRGQHEGQPS